jgi:hypothetical protein
MLQLTFLALVFAFAALSQLTNLAGLLMFSTVMQAGSVLNITTPIAAATGVTAYGVTPFHAASALLVLAGAYRMLRGPRPSWPSHLAWPIALLGAYSIVAILGSLWLPRLYSGISVHAGIQKLGSENLSPLAWNFGHAVQAISLLLLMAVLIAIWLLCQSQKSRHRLLAGLALGCSLVLVLGVYEQLAPRIDMPSVADFWANNPGYHQAPLAPMGLLLNRVGLPFSEPSYASVYLAAMLLGTLSVALLGRAWWLGLPAALLCAFGLINTMGSTGLAAGAAALSVLLFWVVAGALRPSASWSRRLRAIFLCVFLLFATVFVGTVYENSPLRADVDIAVKRLILDKVNEADGSSKIRAYNNQRALEIVVETNGLGVGMGSQRASSFFASLLSNTGVLGFVFFMGMLVSLLWRYWRATALSDAQIFVAAALPTATLAMGVGIPDLNLPMYWGFIFLAFVFCPKDAQMAAHHPTTRDVAVESDSLVESRS